MKIKKLKYLVVGLLCMGTAMGQSKKLEKTYRTKDEVKVHVDARHTQVVVEHWDKDEVEITAVMETKGKEKQEIEKLLKEWNLEVDGDAREVRIKSSGGSALNAPSIMAAMEEPLSKLPEMLAPLQQMIGPMLEGFSNKPLPPEFYASMADLKFDYQAYKKEGDKYLEKFEKQVEKNFGKDFEVAMEEWATSFEKDSTLWKTRTGGMEEFEKSMEAWGESFGKEMEKWGEAYGERMEAWANNLEQEMEGKNKNKSGHSVTIDKENLTTRILTIRMPKKGQLNLNLRHGEVRLHGVTNNLKADLTHSKFFANTISGKNTSLKISYTPVKVNLWNYGMLNAAYVQDLQMDKVVSIKLEANSSDVSIKELVETGIFSGNFGELEIMALSPDFQHLDINLENSDLKLKLPDAAFNFTYSGTQSEISYPRALKVKTSSSYDNTQLKGYSKNDRAKAAVNINANFSEVLLK